MDLFFIRTCFLNNKFYYIFLDIFFYFYLLSLYLLKNKVFLNDELDSDLPLEQPELPW